MDKLVHCQCGNTVSGKDDDDLVANVKEHARDVHGGMEITREQILAMAEPDSEQH
ncbi:MAG TPA: DUF1059 domain-containing protein [Chloroflexota bacterium]|nr:DUF1059 domain-containing protein [Chloroflexota bacterium]